MNSKNLIYSLLKVVFLFAYSCLVCWMAINLINNNPSADLNKYILGYEEFGHSYYEPLTMIYLESIRIVADVLNYKWLLSVCSGVIFFYFIFYKATVSLSIKLFWFFTLFITLPLINVRYLPIFILLLFFNKNIVKYLGVFFHWNYMVLIIPQKVKSIKNVLLFMIIMFITAVIYYFGYFDSFVDKIIYYIFYGEKDIGVGVFLEITLLLYIFKRIYKIYGESYFTVFFVLILSFIFSIMGLSVIASRLVTLSIVISLFQLFDKNKIKVNNKLVLLCMIIVSSYEIYRNFKMVMV